MTTSFPGFNALSPVFTTWGYDDLSDNHPRLGESLPQYDFRLNARDPNGSIPYTWVDQDNSGDFDPKNKCPPPLPPPKRKRDKLIRDDNPPNQASKKPKRNTWQSGRYTGQNGLVTFKVGSDHGRAVLQAFGTSSNNWPHKPQSQPDTQNSDPSYLFSTLRDSSNTSLTSFASTQYLLRNRQNSHTNPYSAEFEHITLGHPSARGCLPCLSLKLPCSLLKESSSYPCLTCRQDSIECELVLPPARKAICESCKRRRVVCSYRAEGVDHSRPCMQCKGVGVKCVAGPATGRTRTGPSLDQGAAERAKLLVKPPKQIAGCVQCRDGKRWCSFRGRKDKEPPCKGCRELQIVCTKELPFRQDRSTYTTSRPKGSATTGVTKTITTRLAHPITFNNLLPTPSTTPSTAEDIPCHWCADPLYGLLGLGAISIEVRDHQDGSGYTEIIGGHTAEGHLPSRMCSECTLDRLMIVGCEGHKLQSLVEAGTGALEDGVWMEYLLPDKVEHAPFAWCSVCPSPAGFGCFKPQHAIDGDGNVEKPDDVGCGLKLCEDCAAMLVHGSDGDLPTLIRRSMEEEADGLGLRADAEFLLPEGELLRQICVC